MLEFFLSLLLSINSLTFSPSWSEVAQYRADDMAQRDYFSHQTPEGHYAYQVLGDRSYSAGAELLARTDNPDSAWAAFNALWASPTHRSYLRSWEFDRVGIGIAHRGSMTYYVVLLCGGCW